MDRYLASYGFPLNSGIKIEFCPYGVDVSLIPPNREGVYVHPQILALGLRLPMTRFIHNVLTFYKIAPSQLSAAVWRMVLEFEAFCDLYASQACQGKVFSTAYLLRKTTQGACYFVPIIRLKRLSSTWSTSTMVCKMVTDSWEEESKDECEAVPGT